MAWKKDIPIVYQINKSIADMEDNFESIMDAYFETFREIM